jgi:hypothetical protein
VNLPRRTKLFNPKSRILRYSQIIGTLHQELRQQGIVKSRSGILKKKTQKQKNGPRFVNGGRILG